MNIKELLKENKEFIVILNNDNRQKFLSEAKDLGFKWYTGKPIDENESCSFHILVKDDFTIGNLSTMCLVKSNKFDNTPRFKY